MFSEQAWAGIFLVAVGCVDILFVRVTARPDRGYHWTIGAWIFIVGVLMIVIGLDNFFGGIT